MTRWGGGNAFEEAEEEELRAQQCDSEEGRPGPGVEQDRGECDGHGEEGHGGGLEGGGRGPNCHDPQRVLPPGESGLLPGRPSQRRGGVCHKLMTGRTDKLLHGVGELVRHLGQVLPGAGGPERSVSTRDGAGHEAAHAGELCGGALQFCGRGCAGGLQAFEFRFEVGCGCGAPPQHSDQHRQGAQPHHGGDYADGSGSACSQGHAFTVELHVHQCTDCQDACGAGRCVRHQHHAAPQPAAGQMPQDEGVGSDQHRGHGCPCEDADSEAIGER